MKRILVLLFALSLGAIAQEAKKDTDKSASPAPQAQKSSSTPAPPAPPKSLAEIVNRQLSGLERQLVPLAEAIPESAYSFKPAPSLGEFKDVRTVRDELVHIAATMRAFSEPQSGGTSTIDDTDQMVKGPANVQSKAEVIKYLKESFVIAHDAVTKGLEGHDPLEIVDVKATKGKMTRFAMANICIWHSFDHYGQLVVYARMNNVVPPASRQN